jgi:hypothetical protein
MNKQLNYYDADFYPTFWTKSQQNFQTVYQNFSGNVYASSDIHGDLHAFIISLRDCARVISKPSFDPTIVDPDIEKNLNIDITDSDTNGLTYDPSLGYRWCGGNDLYVICGDIIDSCRVDEYGKPKLGCYKTDLSGNIIACHQYPQLEIKVLRFINAINANAKTQGFTGKIIKLLGNHDMFNILSESSVNNKFIRDYISFMGFPEDRALMPPFPNLSYDGISIFNTPSNTGGYYRGKARVEVFNPGNIGYDLLFEGGCGVLVMINDTVYCHAEITKNPETTLCKIIEINDIINSGPWQTPPSYNDSGDIIHKGVPHKHWDYPYSQDEPILYNIINDILMPRKLSRTNELSDAYYIKRCSEINEIFSIFMSKYDYPPEYSGFYAIDGTRGIPMILQDSRFTPMHLLSLKPVSYSYNMRLVLGHEPQYKKDKGAYFPYLISSDYSTKTYTATNSPNNIAIERYPVINTSDDTCFGINASCIKPSQIDFKMYFVDVAQSRAFDDIKQNETNGSINYHNERAHFFRRTPQVLQCNFYNNREQALIKIIKSKLRNTRTHLPRYNYEELIVKNNNISNSQYHILQLDNEHYNYKKYLKYKKKYFALRKNII